MTITAPDPAATTPATAAEREAAMWVTRLFSDAETAAPVSTTTTSAFAAYQDAIYDRATIVDLRTPFSQARAGRIAPELVTTVAARTTGGYADLLRMAATTPLILVTDDPANAARTAAHLNGLGLAEVTVMRGGYRAWHTAGLPTD